MPRSPLAWIIAATSYALLGSVSSTYGDVTSNLIAHYPFSGNALDAAGRGHDGTVFGATSTADRFGNPESAYSFDGNDRIDVADAPELTFGANPFTIAAWVRLNQFGADGGYYLLGHSAGPGNTNKWIFWVGTSGISFVVGPSPGWINLGATSFELARWYHVAITREANTLTAYVDGAPIGTASLTVAIPDPAHVLQIGTAEADRPNRPVRGSIDDVRIYGRALSADDLTELVAMTTATTVPSGATTTTTTVPPGSCEGAPSGATFLSVRCRIGALRGSVTAEARIASYQQKLLPPLEDAGTRLDEAVQSCRAGDVKEARTRLKRAGQRMDDYTRRLRSLRARKQLRNVAELREQLAMTGQAIRDDVKTLRRALSCPEDAPAPQG